MSENGISVAHIEAATAAAVPAAQVQLLAALPQWLIPLDASTVGRAKSAVPLSHQAPDLAAIESVEGLYASASLPCAWRLPRLAAFDAFGAALAARGYSMSQPTCVQTAVLVDSLAVLSLPPAVRPSLRLRVEDAPFDDWRGVYLGPGFDPVDAASRIEVLSRGKHTRYAVAYAAGVPAASGALSIYTPDDAPPLASIHGMRTATSHRRQGLARAVIAEFARRAQAAGCEQWFLQVELENTSAQSVYAKLGFETAWVYDYWRRG